MDSIIPALLAVAILILASLMLGRSSFTSIRVVSDAWHDAEERSVERIRSDIDITSIVNSPSITQIDVDVEGAQGAATDAWFVYLWNYATSSYLVGGSASGTTDAVVSFSVTTDPGDYVNDSDGQLTVFVVNQDVSDWIRIDDIKVTIYTGLGNTVYDFTGVTSPSATHTAEDGEIDESDAVIAAGTFGARRNTITGWALWGEASTAEYGNLVGSDDFYYQGADPGANDNAAMIFEFITTEEIGCIDVVVQNDGATPVVDFSRMDVVAQYSSGGSNVITYVDFTTVGSPQPDNTWRVISVNNDVIDPRILNTSENMTLRVCLDPTPAAGSHWLQVTTELGISASSFFTL